MSRSLAAALGLAAAAIGLAALSPPRDRCGEGYVVVRGDTLSHIARRCRSSVLAIARASGVANPNRIEVGQRLIIPGRERMASAPMPARRGPAAAPQSGYRFQPADTLYSLARWARVSVPALLAANPGIDPHKIEIGDPISLPASAVDPAALRARERGVVRVRADVRFDPPRREIRPAPPPPRDDKTDDVEDPRRGPEGM
jgi:LysM repeat protein